MKTIGDGFIKSVEHKHFLRVFLSFVFIVLVVWASYHFWIKGEVEFENQQQAQIQR